MCCARAEEDLAEALARLADELGARSAALPAAATQVPRETAKGAVTSEAVAQTLAALLPEQAVVVEERELLAAPSIRAPYTPPRTTGCN